MSATIAPASPTETSPAAAASTIEPARSAWVGARVVCCADAAIPDLIARIPVYTFAHDGARFCICAGEPLRVAREGEIAYELALDPRAESDAVIRSPFGEIPVRVRTLRAECVREGERLALDCAYLLDFSGELQRHRLRFTVRPQAAEKEGKDDR